MKRTWVVGLVLMSIAAATLLVPAAHATPSEITFTLDNSTATGNSCTACGPFGTVTVAQDGTDTVLVTEKLNGTEFVKTGAGDALSFSITGDPSIMIGSLTTGFSQGSGDNKGDTGDFDYGIGCTGCGNGGSSPLTGPLSFTVTTASALSPADFEVLNGKGFYVASDVIDNANGKTGNVEADDFSATPEPSSMLLFGTGLLAFVGMLRRAKKAIA